MNRNSIPVTRNWQSIIRWRFCLRRVRRPKDKAHGREQCSERGTLGAGTVAQSHLLQSGGSQSRHSATAGGTQPERNAASGKIAPSSCTKNWIDLPCVHCPERPYEFATWKNAKVNIDYHIAFEGHYYSVPHTLVRQEVRIRASESMVQIFHHGTAGGPPSAQPDAGTFFDPRGAHACQPSFCVECGWELVPTRSRKDRTADRRLLHRFVEIHAPIPSRPIVPAWAFLIWHANTLTPDWKPFASVSCLRTCCPTKM